MQDILDGIENEKIKAVNLAVNTQMQKKGLMSSNEICEVRDITSKSFHKKADEARKKFVKAKTLTAEEAKAIVGVDDAIRKETREQKKFLKAKVSEIQADCNKAVHLALKNSQPLSLSDNKSQELIRLVKEPYLKKMKKPERWQ